MGSMPSFTLWLWGDDMSVIRRHFPVLWPLGITCRDGTLDMGNGSRNRPSSSSLDTCRAAEGMFESDDFSGTFRLKPSRRPRMMYWAYALSGWDWRAASHACTLRGVMLLIGWNVEAPPGSLALSSQPGELIKVVLP